MRGWSSCRCGRRDRAHRRSGRPGRRDRNRTGRQVGESGKDVATPHDHVIAEERRQSVRAESHGVLEREDQLAQRMDPASLGDTVGGAHDLALERCMDLGSPGVAVAGPYADEEPAENPGGVVAETGALACRP